MKILGVIPARFASTRFPGKPLADINGKTMIERVYNQCRRAKSLAHVVVATDHPAIFSVIQNNGGTACLTLENHPSGTDRCCEALRLQTDTYDYVINIQGDEPFIEPAQINLLAAGLNGAVQIATLIKPIDQPEALTNPNIVKVVVNRAGEALYFSRAAVPYLRGIPPERRLTEHSFYKHIGMYAYRADVLAHITSLPVSALEKAESLEQLRWMENGYRIQTTVTTLETVGIDTPDDLQKAMAYLAGKK
jgi:3-deoxy-manno-octulosonate cytidylyltransferase (CMP-KDO synthetase)